MKTEKTIDEKIKEKEDQIKFSALLFKTFIGTGIDASLLWKAFDRLEKDLAIRLPIFQIPSKLPTEEYKKYKLQLLEENVYTDDLITGIMTAGISYYFTNLNSKEIDKKLITDYLEYFEFMYSNLVFPLSEIIRVKKNIRKNVTYHNEITNVREYFEENNLKELDLFLREMDAMLRNSLVHKSYYLDEKELYYFNYVEKSDKLFDKRLSKKDFAGKLSFINICKLLFSSIIGFRISGIDIDKI